MGASLRLALASGRQQPQSVRGDLSQNPIEFLALEPAKKHSIKCERRATHANARITSRDQARRLVTVVAPRDPGICGCPVALLFRMLSASIKVFAPVRHNTDVVQDVLREPHWILSRRWIEYQHRPTAEG